MKVELKQDIKFTKALLLEQGRRISDFIEQVKKIDNMIIEFQNENNFIFNISGARNDLRLGYADLYEGLELIQQALGKLELDESLKKK